MLHQAPVMLVFRSHLRLSTFLWAIYCGCLGASKASDGTWVTDLSGNWSDSASWVGSVIADGDNATATFNMTENRTVTLDSNPTIGHIDANVSSFKTLTLSGGTLNLVNSSGDVTIDRSGGSLSISGAIVTSSDVIFSGSGGGRVNLLGNNDSISGNIYINSGAVWNFNTQGLGGSGNEVYVNGGSLTYRFSDSYARSLYVASGASLELDLADRIHNSSELILNGGTFQTHSLNETVGNLTLNADSVIDFGTGNNSTLTFDFSSIPTWNGTLTLLNWGGSDTGSGAEQLHFNGLTEMELNGFLPSIVFDGYTGVEKRNISGNLWEIYGTSTTPPVPETPSVVVGLLILSFIPYSLLRKRLNRKNNP